MCVTHTATASAAVSAPAGWLALLDDVDSAVTD